MPISDNRFLVVSRTIDGKISMAQQLKVEDPVGNEQYVFLKNAFVFQTDKIFEEFKDGIQKINLK